MFHMLYKKSPGTETKNTKKDVSNIIENITTELQKRSAYDCRNLQDVVRHIGLPVMLVRILFKRLIYKSYEYATMFQLVVDFLFQVSYGNPNA